MVDMKNIREHWMAFAIVLLVAAFAVTGSGDYEDAQHSESHYCNMVTLYEGTDGENGWPDYLGKYEDDCGE